MTDSPDFTGLRFSPEARAVYCARFGYTEAEADAAMAREAAQQQRRWEAYQREHPSATVRDFARAELRAVATDLGLPPGLAESLARREVP